MSRVIIKNLPLYLTEDKLKKHFAQKGTVTDVKLMKTRDGRSRRFGFVGYKTESEAVEAVRFFNESFIDTAKLAVEIAKTTKDDSLISTEQRHFREKEKRRREEREMEEVLNRKKQKNLKDKKNEQKISEEDPQLAEYLGAMRPRQGLKSWANDDISPSADLDSKTVPVPEDPEDDEYVQMPSTEVVNTIKDEEDKQEKFLSLAAFDGIKDEEMKPEEDGLAKDENVSDIDWLRMRRQRIVERSQNESENAVVEVDGNADRETPASVPAHATTDSTQSEVYEEVELEQSEEDKIKDKISQTGRLFLRNLLYSATEEEYRELFSKFGQLEEVHIPIDPKSGKSKGFAYVLFKNSEDAIFAYESLDKTIFQGRLLHILPADAKKEHRLDEFDLKNLPLKKQNELRRKAAAAKQQFSWNSLYLNSDAVMESAARKLGVSKSELINPESSDGAVQQALAETSALNNVKEYFESKGVDLLSFNQKEKSDVVILVKNLPYDTSLDEITDMFATYGELRKVLMPPDGGIAMVVFKNAPQARAAFTKLAYRRVKSSILYLEKGPKGLFEGDEDERPITTTPSTSAKEAKPSASEILGTNTAAEEPTDSNERTSLFVKNLNFKTTSADLHNAFKALDGYAVAQIKQKPDPKNTGKTLSMGFGFVEFNSAESANIALKAMDGFILDGHKLQLKISHRGQDKQSETTSSSSQKAKSKILIKNIPFEATKKDIQKLFGTFGQLRTVRLPKKFNKSARGFAFAEFVTAKEAENAMKALQGTHLLGRRLVMEYAEADAENAEQEISRMEAKMRKQVTNETLAGMRLTGKQKNIDLEDEENDLNGL